MSTALCTLLHTAALWSRLFLFAFTIAESISVGTTGHISSMELFWNSPVAWSEPGNECRPTFLCIKMVEDLLIDILLPWPLLLSGGAQLESELVRNVSSFSEKLVGNFPTVTSLLVHAITVPFLVNTRCTVEGIPDSAQRLASHQPSTFISVLTVYFFSILYILPLCCLWCLSFRKGTRHVSGLCVALVDLR